MLTEILDFIKEQLEESRRFKLEMLKCPNCENYAELLKLKQFECDRLVDKINEGSVINMKQEEIDKSESLTDHEPISFKSNRTRSAQSMHESFKHVQKLKAEFEQEQHNKTLNVENADELIVND